MYRFTLLPTIALIFTTATAISGPRQDTLEALEKCALVAEKDARLSCYDALASRIKAAAAAPPEQLAGRGTKEQQQSWFGLDFGDIFGSSGPQTTPQQFGSDRLAQTQEQKATEEAQQLDSITATVTEYAKNPFGKFIVFLDNGQVWHQLQGDADEAHFAKNPHDNKVTISRALFGSYSLSIDGSAKIYKVERVK